MRLWKMLYRRFTEHHGLHNLLWVWNANAPRSTPNDEAGSYADVLAADVCHNDYRPSHHDDLVRLAGGKPVALGEVGHLPSPEILDRQTEWTWFMPWGGLVFRFNTDEQIRACCSHKRVAALEDISQADRF